MINKFRDLDFFKLFGLIAIYFFCSFVIYKLLKKFGHGDDLLIGLGIASVIVTALLFGAIFVMRKKH